MPFLLAVLMTVAGPFVPTMRLEPAKAQTTPGGQVKLTAHLNYDPEGPRYTRPPVTFNVLDAEGGTIDALGLYTAPAKPGRYRIRATRTDFPDVHRDAVVVVKAAKR